MRNYVLPFVALAAVMSWEAEAKAPAAGAAVAKRGPAQSASPEINSLPTLFDPASVEAIVAEALGKKLDTFTSRNKGELLDHLTRTTNMSEKDVSELVKTRVLAAKGRIPEAAAQIARYLAVIGVRPTDASSTTGRENKVFQRLLQSSTRFLFCADLTDWECLEQRPPLPPFMPARFELADDRGRLSQGEPILAGDKLDMEFFFTRGWRRTAGKKGPRSIILKDPDQQRAILRLNALPVSPLTLSAFNTGFADSSPSGSKSVAQILADRILADSTRTLHMAMYGIDDIEGSMKPVFEAIKDRVENRVEVQAVLDVADPRVASPKDGPWLVSYLNPGQELFSRWLFGPAAVNVGGKADDEEEAAASDNAKGGFGEESEEIKLSKGIYEYENSKELRDLLNQGIAKNSEARARIEFPFGKIMHNKFLIMGDDQGPKAVWTGTANLSRTCMGEGINSNMSVYIKNRIIAKEFETEFQQMFAMSGKVDKEGGKADILPGRPGELVGFGRFHKGKRQLNHRLFAFKDGTKARLYFSPQGDGEHRAILPMILSAREGDVIRVSMFGGTGFEIVRAFQIAQARGADVRIVFDDMLNAGATSWTKDPDLNLYDANPYIGKFSGVQKPGVIDVRVNSWERKNHYKAGTLTRAQRDRAGRLVLRNGKPQEGVVEALIVGSQNWSTGGNDENDENMLAIQNVRESIPAGIAFNREFDDRLFPASMQQDKVVR